MLAIVVPAHDEEERIASCIASLQRASRHPGLRGEAVIVVVALDACTDDTAAIARRAGAVTVTLSARNVGVARACGAERALEAGARWLAFTDADSIVAPDWLSAQLAQRSDAVCGTIEVGDWGAHDAALRHQHEATYVDRDGHRHIHGANLGVTAAAYRGVGGFQPLACHEDVALVEALRVGGAHIAWSAAPRVKTSSRRDPRARGGFGDALIRAEATLRRSTTEGGSGSSRLAVTSSLAAGFGAARTGVFSE